MIKFTLANIEEVNEINKISDNMYPITSVYVVGKDDGKLVSYCVIVIKEGYSDFIDAYTLNEKDDYLKLVTTKAAFNLVDLSGIHKVYYKEENENLHKLINDLGFEKVEDNQYFLDLTDYFKPCNCK